MTDQASDKRYRQYAGMISLATTEAWRRGRAVEMLKAVESVLTASDPWSVPVRPKTVSTWGVLGDVSHARSFEPCQWCEIAEPVTKIQAETRQARTPETLEIQECDNGLGWHVVPVKRA